MAFNPKKHPSNHFAALHVSKTLTETEKLKLQLAKLEIENERLKKGYQVKGVGSKRGSAQKIHLNKIKKSESRFEVRV